jgi:hypothetical protein
MLKNIEETFKRKIENTSRNFLLESQNVFR